MPHYTNCITTTERSAKIDMAWDRLECSDLVKLEVEPDESADLSWLDQSDEEMGRGFERGAKKQLDRANTYGVCGLVGYYRPSPNGDWLVGDSCWGFIDDDYKGSGHDNDIKAQTIETLKAALRQRCPHCRN